MTVIAGPWPTPDLARWEDDGGMTLPSTWPPPDWQRFAAAVAAAGRALVELARTIGRAFAGGLRAFADLFDRLTPRLPAAKAARMRAAGRWHTDVEPHRWRDWQPSSERPVDRARRQRLARQLRRRVGAA